MVPFPLRSKDVTQLRECNEERVNGDAGLGTERIKTHNLTLTLCCTLNNSNGHYKFTTNYIENIRISNLIIMELEHFDMHISIKSERKT